MIVSRRTASGYSKKGSDELPFLYTMRRRVLGKSQIIRRIDALWRVKAI